VTGWRTAPDRPWAADERRQFRLLVPAFLRRIFDNDLIPEGVDIRQSVIWLAALFAAPIGVLSVAMLNKYSVATALIEYDPSLLEEIERTTWGDELFFLLYSMTAVGFLTVLVWDSVFPDSRDAIVLGALPVRPRTALAAKLTALLLFVGAFAFAINVPPAFGFALAVTLLGTDLASFHRLAATAVVALAGVAALALAGYALGYRRIARRALESDATPAHERRPVAIALGRCWTRVVRGATQRAVVAFVTQSLMRSRRHRLLLAIYIGVALAFIMRGFVGPALTGSDIPWRAPTAMLLSIPLILSFFILIGLRVLFGVPTDHRANWVFRMTEHDDKAPYLAGVRTTLVLLGLLPLALVTLPLYTLAWGPMPALAHTALWVLLGLLLVEALVTRLRKVPFTCSYVPGKAKMKVLAIPYLALTLFYGYVTARWELWLLDDPTRWMTVLGVMAAILVAVRVARGRFSPPPDLLTYDETPDVSVQQLHLMPPV